jgi:hypothetical protein
MAYIGRDPQYGAFEKQALTADSSTTTFTLDYAVGSASSILVSVAGVHQEPETAYNLGSNGTTIVFTAAPTSGDTVFVIFLGAALEVATIGSAVITARTAHGNSGLQGADELLVYDNSASALKKLSLDNLLIGGTELSATAADNDVLLIYDTSATEFKKIQKSNLSPTLTYVTRNYTGDGSDTTFTVTSGTAVDNVLVFENGVLQKPTTDYQISGTTLTFQGGAPASGVAIQIRELPR